MRDVRRDARFEWIRSFEVGVEVRDSPRQRKCFSGQTARKRSSSQPTSERSPPDMASPLKKICLLCGTNECVQSESTKDSATDSQSAASKASVGTLAKLPNEVIGLVICKLSFKELSQLCLTNKWIRNFVLQYFFESSKRLRSLLGYKLQTPDQLCCELQKERLEVFSELGLLLKRMSCLFPTKKRLDLLIQAFLHLDGIPEPSLNGKVNQLMRFTFQCYGRLIHRFVAGWDDSELKCVFRRLQETTGLEAHIAKVANHPVGARQSVEYFIRSFCRMICIDTTKEADSKHFGDTMFWMKRIMKGRSTELKAKLMLIIYGPLISNSPTPSTTPYIGWWDLTDIFFIESGLEELGLAFFMWYQHNKKFGDQRKNEVPQLLETIVKLPEVWLLENIVSLLFYAGDDITYDYLSAKIKMKNYTDVARDLVFLAVVSFKLTKSTRVAYKMIERLASDEHKRALYTEIPMAFTEAIGEAENAFELDDERDITEVHDITDANNDLLKIFMLGDTEADSSQSSNSDQSSDECSDAYVKLVVADED